MATKIENRMWADLHLHTTCSDGAQSPAEVVACAKAVGLDLIAITDHDTVAGFPEALREGKNLGVEIMAGVEISTYVEEKSVHILGYMMDIDNDAFKSMIKENLQARRDRMERMVDKLNELGYKAPLSEVLDYVGSATMGRALLARYLVDQGYFSHINQVFAKILGDGKPVYEPVPQLSPEEAIETVKNAGGVTSLAHPGYTGVDEMIPRFAEAGLTAIEVENPQHSVKDRRKYREMAKRLGLLVTGGSDSHGSEIAGRTVGSEKVGGADVLRLKERAARLGAQFIA